MGPADHRELRDGLEAARSLVERRFADTGAQLEAAVGVLGGLIQSLDALTRATDRDSVDDTARDLAAAADHLNAMPAARSSRNGHLVRLRRLGLVLQGHMATMRRTLQYLRVFALNIKVAAASAPESAEVFAGFAEDMYERIDLGAEQISQFCQQLDDLEAQLATSLDFEQRLEREYARVLPDVPERLAADAAAVTDHHRRVADTSEKVALLARALQKKVTTALLALQIGDITRQRIEHVQAGLELVLSQGAARGPAVRQAVIRMLADQMADIAADFDREVERMSQSLSGVAADADRIIGLQQELSSGDDGKGGLRGLETSVSQAMGLVDTVQAATENADRIGCTTTTTVEGLVRRVGAVKGVKDDIHRMALNTSLRCSRLGEIGKPLNVIAFELGFQADHLERSAGETLTCLRNLSDAAAAIAAPAAEREDAARPSERLEGAIERLKLAADVVERDLKGAAAQGSEASEALAGTVRRLDIRREVGAVLHQTARALEDMAGAADGPADASELRPLMDQIAALYTMARERTVHARHAAAGAETAEATADEDPDAAVLF